MSEAVSKAELAETQKERWIKYGANVVVVSLAVIGIALALIFLSRHWNRRLDTTTAGLFSLKPQTVNLIRNNKSDIKIISLYTKLKPEEINAEGITDFATPVADLLEEYKSKGRNIDVEVIDPQSQSAKVDALIAEVEKNYGGETARYRKFIDEFLPTQSKPGQPSTQPTGIYVDLKGLVQPEAEKLQKVTGMRVTDPDLAQTLILAMQTLNSFPKQLDRTKEAVDKTLKEKIPDYKGAVNTINIGLSDLSENLKTIIEEFTKARDNPKTPKELKDLMAAAIPNYEKIRNRADEVIGQIKQLGELKLDEVRSNLRQQNSILVLGKDEMRAIPFEKVWQVPDDVRGFTTEGKPKPRFAGEQQITSAIISLQNKVKPKVVFVRPGGSPLTMPGIPGFQRGGPFSIIAGRLRDYNFDVLEKDLSGQWAMQAQMQGQFAPPEPSDEEIKDAIWIVLNIQAGPSRMGPPPSIAGKVKDHLDHGGSALILTEPNGDALSDALDPWGIKINPKAIAVHEPIPASSDAKDIVEQAQRVPYIFIIKDFGDHPLAKPLRSLDGVLVPITLVQTDSRKGYKTSPLVPVPRDLNIWGETDVQSALEKQEVKYTKGEDIDAPLFGGGASEKDGGGRVVALGSASFCMDQLLSFWDENLRKQRILATRFPANAELMINSVLWLSKQDTMLSISPSAMEVSRIGDMSRTMQNFWRIDVLLIGLPCLVLALGALVYVKRRD